MFDSSDVQSVFSGNIAEEWEKKSRYINSLNGNDNMMIPTIKKYITSTSKIKNVNIKFDIFSCFYRFAVLHNT